MTKTVMFLILFASLGVNALAAEEAASPKYFVGKYRAVEGDCVKNVGPYRAHVGYDAAGKQLVLQEFPLGDKSFEEIPLVSGIRKTAGSSNRNAVVVIKVSTDEGPAVMAVKKSYYVNSQLKYVESIRLDANHRGYLIKFETGGRYCKYQRAN